jgi:hypothetical protein
VIALARAHAKKSIDDWVVEIKGFFTRASTDTIELARTVHAARTQLPYGQWAELCRFRRLPFAKKTGDRLIAIWDGLRNLDGSTLSHLPNGRSVLYLLSRLPSSLLIRLVQEGAIHPALSHGEAKALVAKYRRSGCSPKFNVQRRVGNFRDFVRSTRGQWNSQDMKFARAVLAELVDELGHHCPTDEVTEDSFAPLFVKPSIIPLPTI